jgi:hypothetical protein
MCVWITQILSEFILKTLVLSAIIRHSKLSTFLTENFLKRCAVLSYRKRLKDAAQLHITAIYRDFLPHNYGVRIL